MQEQRQSDDYCEHTAHIVERIYNLFHGLCANRRTSDEVLRYFRSNCNDFLVRHLSAMPFRQHREDHMLHAMSHLMNCVSIEIKLAAMHGQTTRYYLLCEVLLAVHTETQRNGQHLPLEVSNTLLLQTSSGSGPNYFNASDALPGRIMLSKTLSTLHVNRLLDSLILETQSLSHPSLNFFDEALIAKLMVDCESKSSAISGAGMINVHKLHDILHDELYHVQSTIASGQRKEIVKEIKVLLQHAIQMNCVRMQRCAIYNFMNAWCRLVQVLFGIMPDTVMPVIVRKQHIIDITEKILLKVEPQQPLIKISIQVTETVLLLLANLRRCYYQLEDQRALDEHGNVVCLSDDAAAAQNGADWAASAAAAAGGGGGAGAGAAGALNGQLQSGNGNAGVSVSYVNNNAGNGNSSNMRFILKRLIDWIMTTEVKSQKLSINVYGALLNCLRIVKRVRTKEQIEYNNT